MPARRPRSCDDTSAVVRGHDGVAVVPGPDSDRSPGVLSESESSPRERSRPPSNSDGDSRDGSRAGAWRKSGGDVDEEDERRPESKIDVELFWRGDMPPLPPWLVRCSLLTSSDCVSPCCCNS